MRNYWLNRVGQANKYAAVAKERSLVALGWTEVDQDLGPYANMEKKEFVEKISPLIAEKMPERTSKYYDGSARQLYKFAALMNVDDVVLMPNEGSSIIDIGIIQGGYYFDEADEELPYRHRRKVKWVTTIDRNALSEKFRNSAGAIQTLFSLNSYSADIEAVLAECLGSTVDVEERLKAFGLESQLEQFIIENWERIPEFKDYELFTQEGDEEESRQYITKIGRIDILARSKTDRSWLVIELKRGDTSDKVVGQVLRYMGWILENEAEPGENVRGLIIANQNDERLRYALKAVSNVSYLTYEVNFTLKTPAS